MPDKKSKSTEMENPYEKFGAHPCEVKAGRGWLWIFAIVFVLGISLTPLLRNFSDAKKDDTNRWVPAVEFWNHPNAKGQALVDEKRKNSSRVTREKPSLRDHLGAVEKEIKAGDFRKRIEKTDQARLTSIFNEGNAKAVIGRDGWYFFQPAVDGLVGYGPLKPEPDSVTKDPDRPDWNAPLPVIEKFAAQLRERGIELMIVPVPVKPMVHPEFLDADLEAPLRHPDQAELYEKIRAAGIEVVDVLDDMVAWKKDGPVFLKQDTHWTHDTMERVAEIVAEKVKAKPWFSDLEIPALDVKTEVVSREWIGDLVNMLTADEPGENYEPETQEIVRVLGGNSQPLASDSDSPIALLGDSFVNVFDTPLIGFGAGEDVIGAGFANTLAKNLGMKLDVHTSNGGGSTVVRQKFAGSGKDVVGKKKLVIWTLASRDLLLSEKGKVRWRDVEFAEQNAASLAEKKFVPGSVIVGEILERSPLADPNRVDYPDSIFPAHVKVTAVESGEFPDEEALVYFWGFQKKKLLPESQFQVGDSVKMELNLLSDVSEVKGINQAEQLAVFSIPYFATKADFAEGQAGKTIPLGFWLFVFGVLIYVVVGVTIQLRAKRHSSRSTQN